MTHYVEHLKAAQTNGLPSVTLCFRDVTPRMHVTDSFDNVTCNKCLNVRDEQMAPNKP